jgi:hypothetical protein
MYPGHSPFDWLAECAGPHLSETLAPAMRAGALTAIGEDPGDRDEQRRRQPLARMAIADPALDAIYRYWRSRRGDGLLPGCMQVEIPRLTPAEGHVALVHVGGAHPHDHRFRPDGAVAWFGHARVAAAGYAAVAQFGTPHYEDVIRHASREPGYGRLVLPLAEDGRRVDILAVCTNARA